MTQTALKKLSLALLALVCALALVETAAALSAPLRAPAARDWQAAAREVRAGFRDGDLIVFAPPWTDQIGRAHLGDLIPVEMAARADADRYQRIWEVSIRGAHAPETAGLAERQTAHHGRVAVALFDKGPPFEMSALSPPAVVTYDFTTHACDGIVTQAESPCLRDGHAFRCPAGGVTVEPRTLEIDYAPRRGILAPLTAGPVALEFVDAELGGALVGYLGLHDYYARKSGDGPIELRVVIDGAEAMHVRARNEDGFRRFSLPTSAGRHRVRFELSTPNPAWRNAGLHAEARR